MNTKTNKADPDMGILFWGQTIRNRRGAVAILVGFCLFIFVGFAALAIDIGNLLVAKNELQNAADAGALAGARYLYNENGTAVNPGANQIAYDAARANSSQKTAVDVNWQGGNGGDVERGHYCFATATFTPNDSLAPTQLWDVSEQDLDLDPDFINAVHVTARRQATPITAFFAGIFGYAGFDAEAEAVAYIGYAGNLRIQDIDEPIAICQQALLVNDQYTCSIGRMINSGNNAGTSNTGGWTSYSQNNPCSGGTNAAEMRNLVCGDGNPEPIRLGEDVATIGGQLQTTFDDFYDCWVANSDGKTQPWEITLLVVDCPGNNLTTCQEVVGAVTLTIVWINSQNDPQYNDAPEQMGAWSNDDPDGQVRWNDFVAHFNLKNLNENGDGLVDAPYAKKSIYFLPDCNPHEPTGGTGGRNFGILARIPVLVQ